jgi:hypothetical protein
MVDIKYIITDSYPKYIGVNKIFDTYMSKERKSLSSIQLSIRDNNICIGSSYHDKYNIKQSKILSDHLSYFYNYVYIYKDKKICTAAAIKFFYKSDEDYDFDCDVDVDMVTGIGIPFFCSNVSGYGTFLLTKLLEMCEENNWYIKLNPTNEDNKKFYEKNKFKKKSNSENHYYKPSKRKSKNKK